MSDMITIPREAYEDMQRSIAHRDRVIAEVHTDLAKCREERDEAYRKLGYLSGRGISLDDYIALVHHLEEGLKKAIATFGHDHWDSTMKHGAGCTTCIEQSEARRFIGAILSKEGK